MKKIFRMALVFALAGATLMYTGCTKDYSEDINGLSSDVATLNSNLQTLQQDVNTLKSSVSALESAYKAADAALQKAIDGNSSAIATNSSDIAALKTAVDALKIQIAADETRIAAAEAAIKKLEAAAATHATKDELNSAVNDLQQDIADLVGQVKKQSEDFTAALNAVKVDLDAAKAAIALNEAAIKANGEAIIKNAEDIKANAEAIALAQAAITAAEGRIAAAEAGIAANAEAIAANKKAVDEALEKALALIAANKDAIAANAEQIEAALAAIAKNKAAIEVNKKAIEDVLALALENKGNIAENKAAIDLLKEAVEANATKIAAVEELANANKEAIAANLDAIRKNAEEIVKNAEAIGANKADIETLKADIETLKGLIAKNAEAIAANKLAIDANTADIATNKANIEANAAEIAFIKENYATKDDLQKVIDDLAAANDELGAFKAVISNELRSIVFVPDFYFAGIEATSFDIASIWSYVPKENKKDVKDGIYTFPKTAKLEWEYDYDEEEEIYPNDYTVSQIGAAKYDLNPSSFDVKNAKWSLVGMDRKYVVKGEEPKVWAPVFEGISVENGVASVQYTIENPDSFYAGVFGAFMKAAPRPEPNYVKDEREWNNVPVMKLVAELEEGKTVSSDWAAIVADGELLSHLAFAKGNAWVTEYTGDCDINAPKVKDLYDDAVTTAKDTASVFVKYNGGEVDLAEFITIHSRTGFEEYKDYTLAEWNAKYPGFTFNFEEVPYTIGKNLTSEDMYGQLDGSVFTPCYVKSEDGKAESIAIAKDSEDKLGISAVGRMPIILVTLTDANGIVATAGYFKIQITKDAPKPIEPKFFEVPSFGTVPFVCTGIKMSTTWDVFSFYVLETLGVDYAEFNKTYSWDEKVYAYEPKIGQDGKVVVKDGKEVTELVEVGNKYGKVTYTKDKTGTGINDAFTWNVQSKKIGEGKSKSVYLKFVSATEVVYFELKADVAKAASFDFGANKIANEWFDDIDNEAKNTVRINVLVPNTNEDDVTEFYRDLNKFYIGYKPAVALADDADPVYSDKAFEEKLEKELVTKSEFYFDAEQPVIVDGDNWWILCTNGTILYTAAVDGEGKIVAPNKSNKDITDLTGQYVFNQPIATIDPDSGVITYYYDDDPVISKILLNLWSYTEKAQAKMLYANILVKTTYGDCKIPAGEEKFHVRFVRPIDVNFTAQDVAEESAVGGANVQVAKFISGIVDWNKQNVIVKEKDSKGKETGYYVANVIKGVDMYKYYGFSKLTIDLENAERDGHEISDPTKRELVSKVYPGDERLLIGTVNDKDIFTETGNNEITITDFSALKGVAINYQNNRSVIGTFNIYIPVSVEYAWGTIESELVIKIKSTSETGGK